MILVSGATGFIGRYLVKRLLSEGRKILCFVKNEERDTEIDAFLRELKVPIVYGDIRDHASVSSVFEQNKGISSVIHLAAIIKPTVDDSEFAAVNVDGTRFLVEACEKHNITRFIFYSTDFVLYDYPTIYGKSKADAENVIMRSSLDYTILRPTPVYGVGDDKNFNTLFKLVDKYRFAPSVSCVMQPVAVQDVVDATMAVFENPKTFRKTYNLPGASAVSFKQILKLLADEMGKSIFVVTVPNFVMRTTVRLYERLAKNPIVRDYQVSKWVLNKELSIDENKRDFGYNPIGFEDGMRETMRALGISRKA